MKTIVAGSRSIANSQEVGSAISEAERQGIYVSELVCGMARGVDLIGRQYAQSYEIPIREFPANWDLHGRAAGPIRNQEMVEYADALIAVWDGESRGTKDIISRAKSQGLKTFIKVVRAL